MKTLKAFLISVAILIGLWLLLQVQEETRYHRHGGSRSSQLDIFRSSLQVLGDLHLGPRALIHIPLFVAVFLLELVKSTLDVARRVLSPSLPINPGIIKVKTRLISPLGRIILANSITLTPGTMTVDTDGEDLYIHWIDITTSDVDIATAQIVSKFEKHLEVIFG
jgi:multicomponent Na+:H+ antiporter subunit E